MAENRLAWEGKHLTISHTVYDIFLFGYICPFGYSYLLVNLSFLEG